MVSIVKYLSESYSTSKLVRSRNEKISGDLRKPFITRMDPEQYKKEGPSKIPLDKLYKHMEKYNKPGVAI